MYNKSQLSRDHKAAKEPKKIARPKDKFVIPGAPKVDPNGYWDPANVGRIIEVPLNKDSRSITMSYPDGTPLDQPLIGIGTDTGMMQYMMPGRDYIFPNDSSVIEGPIMEAGGTIIDLTDDEIKMYRDAGYVVDLTPYPERHNPANAFSVKDPRSMQPGGTYTVDPNNPNVRIYNNKYAYNLAKKAENDSLAAYHNYLNNRTPPAFTYDERNWAGVRTGNKVKPKPSDKDVQRIPSVVGTPAVKNKYGWKGISGNSNPYDDYDYKCYEGDPRCNEKGLVDQFRGIDPSGYEVIDWTYPTGNKSRAVVSVFDEPKIKNVFKESSDKSDSKNKNNESRNISPNAYDPEHVGEVIYISKPEDNGLEPELRRLPFRPIPQAQVPEGNIIPNNTNYKPTPHEFLKLARRSQTIMEPDPDRPGEFRMKEQRYVPYSAHFPGEGWESMDTPTLLYYDPNTGEETIERPKMMTDPRVYSFQNGGIPKAQNGKQTREKFRKMNLIDLNLDAQQAAKKYMPIDPELFQAYLYYKGAGYKPTSGACSAGYCYYDENAWKEYSTSKSQTTEQNEEKPNPNKLKVNNKPKPNMVKVNNPSKVNIEIDQRDKNGNVISTQEYYDFPPVSMPTRKVEGIDIDRATPEIIPGGNEQTLIKRYDPEQNKWIINEVNTTDPSVQRYEEQVNWARKNPQNRESSLFISPEEYVKYNDRKKRQSEILNRFLTGMDIGGTYNIGDVVDEDTMLMLKELGYEFE